jgi:hypothetical protein
MAAAAEAAGAHKQLAAMLCVYHMLHTVPGHINLIIIRTTR